MRARLRHAGSPNRRSLTGLGSVHRPDRRQGIRDRHAARTRCAGLRGRAPRARRLRGLAAPRQPRGSPTSSAGARPRSTCATGTPRSTPSSPRGPSVVVVAAAKVGGILANSTYPVDFLNDNLRIQTNLFEAAHAADVDRLLFLGSSCIYPKLAPQPIPESSLLTGPLEPTNDAYAIAKIAGIMRDASPTAHQYGRRWISAMPTNLYGPGDNFDLHVVPRAAGDDPQVPRGQGVRRAGDAVGHRDAAPRVPARRRPRRRRACTCCEHYDSDPTRSTSAPARTSRSASSPRLIAEVVGYTGEIVWDTVQARRHPAQAARRLTAAGARLGAADRPARGDRLDLRVVPRERGVRLVSLPLLSLPTYRVGPVPFRVARFADAVRAVLDSAAVIGAGDVGLAVHFANAYTVALADSDADVRAAARPPRLGGVHRRRARGVGRAARLPGRRLARGTASTAPTSWRRCSTPPGPTVRGTTCWAARPRPWPSLRVADR